MGTDQLRAHVAESWHRSAAAGVDASVDHAPITLNGDGLAEQRSTHRLAQVFPLLDDVLGQTARDCDAIMAVSDADAQLLWVCGSNGALTQAETFGFVAGANWDERLVGTNAPGTALATGQAVSVIGAEHYRHVVQPWSCAAAPIHDPLTSELLGVVDMTGRADLVTPQTMAMVRAVARMAESELATATLRSADLWWQPGERTRMRIQALGRDQALLQLIGRNGRQMALRLSPRHSEIVVLLANSPGGLSGDQLAVLLYEEDQGGSTTRAELNRLRQLLGDDLPLSRPYRLDAEIKADWLGVGARLNAAKLASALRRFGGPLLPRSVAPGIVELREQVPSALRQAVITSRAPELMSLWTRSVWGFDDHAMWAAQRRALPPDSPLLPLVDSQLSRLDAKFG